jgi:hypothetical protein
MIVGKLTAHLYLLEQMASSIWKLRRAKVGIREAKKLSQKYKHKKLIFGVNTFVQREYEGYYSWIYHIMRDGDFISPVKSQLECILDSGDFFF